MQPAHPRRMNEIYSIHIPIIIPIMGNDVTLEHKGMIWFPLEFHGRSTQEGCRPKVSSGTARSSQTMRAGEY